jgi:hypothetical protein
MTEPSLRNGPFVDDPKRLDPSNGPAGIPKWLAGTRWRLFPTILFAIFGVLAIVSGGAGLLWKALVLFEADGWQFISEKPQMLIVSSLFLAWGILWVVAARASWRQRWWVAIGTGICGVVAYWIGLQMRLEP